MSQREVFENYKDGFLVVIGDRIPHTDWHFMPNDIIENGGMLKEINDSHASGEEFPLEDDFIYIKSTCGVDLCVEGYIPGVICVRLKGDE